MLRTQGFFEGVPIGDKKVHSEIETAFPISAELLGASSLGLQKPFGENDFGFAAGKVAQLKPETDGTVAVTVSDGSQPEGVLVDSFVDTLKSGKATYYSYFGDYFTDQFDTTKTYLIGENLFAKAGTGLSDPERGKFTNAKADSASSADGQKVVVGHVVQVPDLANGVLLGVRWQVGRSVAP